MAKWTFEEIKNKLAVIHPEVELMQDFYVNTQSKMKCRCKVCGNLFEMSWNSLQQGSSCVACFRAKRSKVYKTSLEDMILEVSELNPDIIVLNEEYGGNVKSPIFCKCKLDSYEWKTTIKSIRAMKKCPKCSGCGKLTMDEIKRDLKIINQDVEIATDVYINSKTKMKCKCKVDNNIFYASWNTLQKGVGCPICGVKKCGGKNKLKIDAIKTEIGNINNNVTIISDEYTSYASTDLECYCNIHNEYFTTSYLTLKKGGGCPKCARESTENAHRLTYDFVKSEIEKNNPNVELLEDSYISATTKMKCLCKIDNEIFFASWTTFQMGHSCPTCGIRKNSGEGNANWKGGISPLTMHLRCCITQWKNDSKRASHYKCVVTGKKFDHIHHVYGFDLILRETLEIEKLDPKPTFSDYTADELRRLENTCAELHKKYGLGVALSESEHTLFHQKYGYGENNPSQWKEFLKTRKEFYDKNTNR